MVTAARAVKDTTGHVRRETLLARSCKKKLGQKREKRTYGTADSHVVPHHSTDAALSSLTLQIERDAVLLAWYGRRWRFVIHCHNILCMILGACAVNATETEGAAGVSGRPREQWPTASRQVVRGIGSVLTSTTDISESSCHA